MMQAKRRKRPAEKRRLTELAIRKAKPKAEAYLIWDTQQRGLGLRVWPTDRKSWYAVYSRHGRARWLYLGDANAIGLADARTLAAEAMLAVARGADPAAEKKAERSAGTFADLAAKYVDQYAKKNNKSWAQADALVRRHALPRWGKLQASSITRGDVKQMMARIDAPSVANQALAAVSAIFSWGMKEEVVAANPCKLVERNSIRSRERILSESEVPLLWSALDDIDPVSAMALKVILLTGQRPGEAANMRREHIVDGWWQMPGEPIPNIWPGTKNSQSHRVWLPKPVQALLGSGAASNGIGFVFAGPRGGPVSHLDGAMRDICTKLGIERATPHDLRRTHGSTITALGFGRDAMNRIQNHKEGGIADVYDRHHYEAETKHIMESVASKIMGLIEGQGSGKVLPFAR
ncbi:MAG: tyrosine-type recombinase/integrase [Xanthobacteraceae bacterium]